MSHLYVMPTLFGPIDALMDGVKVGTTVKQPWERLRAYRQSGVMYEFKYVYKGDVDDIKKLERLFHECMDEANIQNMISATCTEVYFLDEDMARDQINELIEDYDLNVTLVYTDYTSCNKSNHELKYSEERGVKPRQFCFDLFIFPEAK
jgi:hypothetical protein